MPRAQSAGTVADQGRFELDPDHGIARPSDSADGKLPAAQIEHDLRADRNPEQAIDARSGARVLACDGTSQPGPATRDEGDQSGVRVGGEGGTVGPGHAAMMTEPSGLLDPMIARA